MDPINLLVGLNLFVSMSANLTAAKKGLRTKFTGAKEKPITYLQKIPPNIAALVLVLLILGVFKIFTLSAEYEEQFFNLRVIGLVVFLVFSWVQVYAFKSLGENYAQDIVIFKNHELHKKGLYGIIRHPQYLSQILSDLGAAVALLSYVALPVILLVEIPLFILRARYEDQLLEKHFGDEFKAYKKKTGFMIPFIG